MENFSNNTKKWALYKLSRKITLYMTLVFILLFFIAEFSFRVQYGYHLSALVVFLPNLCCALAKIIVFLILGRKKFLRSFWNELKVLIIAFSLYIPFLFVNGIAFIDVPRILSYILFLQFNFAIYFFYKGIKEKDSFRLLNALLALLSFLCSLCYSIRGVTFYILFGAYGVAIAGAILCMRDKLKINLFNIVGCIAIFILVRYIADLFSKMNVNGIVYTDSDLSGLFTIVFLFLAESVYNIAVKNRKNRGFRNVFANLTLPYIFLWGLGFVVLKIYFSFISPVFMSMYNEYQVYFLILVNFILFFKHEKKSVINKNLRLLSLQSNIFREFIGLLRLSLTKKSGT